MKQGGFGGDISLVVSSMSLRFQWALEVEIDHRYIVHNVEQKNSFGNISVNVNESDQAEGAERRELGKGGSSERWRERNQ